MRFSHRGTKDSREPWFGVRRDLSAKRSSILSLVSFALPLAIWAGVSYLPFLWHPDIRLQISADREDVATVYIAGDRVSKGFFPQITSAVRDQNASIEAQWKSDDPLGGSTESAVRRSNKKILRHLAPVLISNGVIDEGQSKDDAAIYRAWKDIAEGTLDLDSPELAGENITIVQQNWKSMRSVSETYDSDNSISRPLLSLIPQGKSANPDYLPSPDQVVAAGVKIFTQPPEGDRPSMLQRVGHSMRIVFGGFFLAALIGVPVGVLCGTYSFFSKLVEPFTDFFRYMPAPTFSTLLVAIFLANDAPKIALVFVGTFFQLVLVVSNTTRRLDLPLLEAAQTLGANQMQLLMRVVIPGILPNLYNDLRILLGWAWTWLVIAELIGVKSGLTEFIETQGRFRNFDMVYPVIILIGLIGFFTDQILALLRGVVFPYTDEGSAASANPVIKALLFLPRWFKDAAEQRLPHLPDKSTHPTRA
ncbi:MAG: ABC transporter permease [Verrucomicrobiales bacterium]|nr:ABC transporter permease [Verrucomicrobiales bacterium]